MPPTPALSLSRLLNLPLPYNRGVHASTQTHSREEAESKFMRPFGLQMPEKARSPIVCLAFQQSNGCSLVTCPYFTALRDASGNVLRCYKLEESPARYVLHCESHVLPNVLNGPTVETVWTKDEGTLTHSSILAVNGGLFLPPFFCFVHPAHRDVIF